MSWLGRVSALFTPFPRPGLIVLDEEHDNAYKQMRTPRYHARDAAIELARLAGAVVLLGSATPSLESSFQARRGVYQLLELPHRVMGHLDIRSPAEALVTQPTLIDLPPVEIIDMREELRAGNRSMFSRSLASTLAQVLARSQQVILFLNRRGSASFVLCRDCGHVMHCPRCDLPLTYHGGNLLLCHHCNHREAMPAACPKCGSRRFKEFGAGTQRVIDALAAEFPQARPLRWDRDTTGGKTSHEDILQDFIDHKADVLVGTQMIAKGLDLPLVTLVGVLSADVGLFLPELRAAEQAFQVLMQVAGRGRPLRPRRAGHLPNLSSLPLRYFGRQPTRLCQLLSPGNALPAGERLPPLPAPYPPALSRHQSRPLPAGDRSRGPPVTPASASPQV